MSKILTKTVKLKDYEFSFYRDPITGERFIDAFSLKRDTEELLQYLSEKMGVTKHELITLFCQVNQEIEQAEAENRKTKNIMDFTNEYLTQF